MAIQPIRIENANWNANGYSGFAEPTAAVVSGTGETPEDAAADVMRRYLEATNTDRDSATSGGKAVA